MTGASEGGLTAAEVRTRFARDGPNDIPEQRAHPFFRFAGKFWGLSAWMIELIALLSLVLHKWADFWVALALLLVNAILGFLQEQRASAAVSQLRSRLQVTARVLRDGAWQPLPARELVANDLVRLRTGDFVPADVRVLDGTLSVDQSMLTGESSAVSKPAGAALYSGSIVREGEATALVTATGARTYYGRTAALVESAHPKLHVEAVVARVVRWLFAIVTILVLVTLAVSLAQGTSLIEILPLALVLLMSAVPVALPVMFTVSMAVGSVELARKGVLVTRLSAAEDAANMDVLCADKTGTLTLNRLQLADSWGCPGHSAEDVVRYGAWASNEADQDPVDAAFLRAAAARGLPKAETLSFIPFSAATRRTEAQVQSAQGTCRVMKGALKTLAGLAGLDPAAVAALELRAEAQAHKGYRVLAVACAHEERPLELAGLAYLYDAPRPDSKTLVGELKALGVAVKMLTGDARPVAREVGRAVGLPDIEAASVLRQSESAQAAALAERHDGFAEVFPEDKFTVVRDLQALGRVVGMTGDGVNDAPALRQAEVGIAVSGATDVAKAAGSVVLTTEGLEGIVDLVRNGRMIYQRVLTWIINKISRTILKAGFVVVAFLASGKFVISALGMVLLVFMTDFVKIALATDSARPSRRPETWRIAPLLRLAVLLGLVMLAQALALLAFAWHGFGLAHDEGRLQTFTFQTLLFFALFSILSVRERRAFWASRPSATLAAALLADGMIGIFIGAHGLGELRPLPAGQTAVLVLYALLCALVINDFIKRAWMARSHRPQSTDPSRAPPVEAHGNTAPPR